MNANKRTAKFSDNNITPQSPDISKISAKHVFCIVRSGSRCFDLELEEACHVNEYKYSPRNPSVGDYLLRAAVDEGLGGYFGGAHLSKPSSPMLFLVMGDCARIILSVKLEPKK